MADENYKIIVPVLASQCLEVTTGSYPTSTISPAFKSQLRIYESHEKANAEFNEIYPEEQPYLKVLNFFKEIKLNLIQYDESSEVFMLASATGFQIIRSKQILYLEYSKNKKQWVAVLDDQTYLLLKRNTSAQNIQKYSSTFFRINNKHIVNSSHLLRIDNKVCRAQCACRKL